LSGLGAHLVRVGVGVGVGVRVRHAVEGLSFGLGSGLEVESS